MLRFSQVIIIVPLLIAVVACEVAGPPVSAQLTASPVATLQIDSPQPEPGTKPQSATLAPESPAAPTAQPNDDKQIVALLDEMETAVLAQNRDLYLSYIDLSDPIFALEHTRWADEWSQQDIVTHFDLTLDHLVIEGDEATADLTMIWRTTANNPASQGADFPVRFQKSKDGAWRYAGEAWLTFETEHFQVRAMPGLVGIAKEISPNLPEIYDYVTNNFGHTPSSNLEIKLYDTSAVLVANTLLSLPEIHGWNEPGESLKLVAAADEAPPLAALAHEFTHFLTFDMAGTARPRMPWWLTEGIAMEIGSHYWTISEQNNRLDQVREWATEGRLIEWDRISDFETTPVELWQYVHPQGYAFVRYVTETFGIEKRNAWLHAMAVEMDLPEATQTQLSMSFDELNVDFLAWLEAPLNNTGDMIPTTRAMAPFDPASFRMGLEQIANGFERPVYVTDAGDGSNRLFVVEQAGRIRVVDVNGQVLDPPFLDIHERVSSGGERGLLSVAFHPDYETNGFFYVDYTDLNGDTVIARYSVSQDHSNRADPGSEWVILAVAQPASNHNGGLLLFGPDDYLYVGLGDGGGGRSENGQRQDTLLGKILRIDVNQTSGNKPYAVPPDNPFVQDPDVRPEIWAYGLRNPWRFSFDRATGDLYIGDVGAATYEEINFQPAGSQGGENYGWNLMEGSKCRQAKGGCNTSDLDGPIAEYKHGSGGCVVTGGYVYRGQAVPTLTGTYLFADYCSGRVWGLGRNLAGAWVMSNPVETELRISSFGEDEAGELYLVDIGGAVYRIVTRQP